MTRPSRNTDDLLVKAALALLPKTGFSGLKMRAVAEKAGVNLGMFHYHFKTKDAFMRRVASEVYEQFYQAFSVEVQTGGNPKEQLINAVKSLVRFARDNRRMMLGLARDVMDGNTELVRLLEAFIPRHGVVLVRLLRECQKKGYISNVPLPVVMTYLLGGMAGPVILAALIEQAPLRQPYDFLKKIAVPYILSDAVIDKRLEFIFQGIDPAVARGLNDKKWEQQIDQFVRAIEKDQEKPVHEKKKAVRKTTARRSA